MKFRLVEEITPTYKEYIQSIIDTRGQWNIPENEYYEGHHIIPKEYRWGRKN